jgi:hypothetical protein
MAWRPKNNLIEGELDNTTLGRVTGWMRFTGLDSPVLFDLEGDFHRDIRGAKLRLVPRSGPDPDPAAGIYMQGFALAQTGWAGDITAGKPPYDYERYPYIEWYSEENGRVVIELESDDVEVLGDPIPWKETRPVDRAVQDDLFDNFTSSMAAELRASAGQEMKVEVIVARFYPGELATTPGVEERIPREVWSNSLRRHLSCHWGDLGPEDSEKNDRALKEGGRLFSRYRTEDGTVYYIITEADRSATTVLLASEY